MDSVGATAGTPNCGHAIFKKDSTPPCGDRPINEYGIYDDYKLAVSVAERMNEIELEQLKAYNAEHGTHYEVHFTKPHDAKSK